MASCRDVAGLIGSDELSEAGWRRRLSARLHLLMCRHCRRYAAQLRAVGTAARKLWAAEPEDPRTLEKLELSILERTGTLDGACASGPAGGPDRGRRADPAPGPPAHGSDPPRDEAAGPDSPRGAAGPEDRRPGPPADRGADPS